MFQDFVPLKSRKFRWEPDGKKEPKKRVTSVDERLKIIDDEVGAPVVDSSECKEPTREPVIPEGVDLPPSLNYSFKPFASDKNKQDRYEKFLMFKKLGLKGNSILLFKFIQYWVQIIEFCTLHGLLLTTVLFADRLAAIQPSSMTEWEKEREKSEFEQASRLYRPLSEDMADRFTTGAQEDALDILTPVAKTMSTEQQTMKEAAAKKMYGVLTRRKFSWIPERILCKRFNVPEPAM